MTSATRLAVDLVLIIGCVGCDQVSKQLARDHLRDAADTWLVTTSTLWLGG